MKKIKLQGRVNAFHLVLLPYVDKKDIINNKNLNTVTMKKVIAIIAIGTFLTSCAGGWSCKKRYCNATNKKAKTEITKLPTKETIIAQP